jgi:hypothetical protein
LCAGRDGGVKLNSRGIAAAGSKGNVRAKAPAGF